MKWSSKALVAALLLTIPVLSSCSEQPDLLAPPTQVVAGPQEGLLGDLLGGVVNVVSGVLNILSGPDANGKAVSAWIDEDGGTLSVAAYKLTVPRGAVSKRTLFELAPANDGTYKVELNAYRQSLLGRVEVGSRGFDRPVLFTVSFANANGVTDPRKLIIIYLRNDGTAEIQPGVIDQGHETVTSPLSHFSKYALMQN